MVLSSCFSAVNVTVVPALPFDRLWCVIHVLRICTVIAIEHNYDVSVLMLYIFSVGPTDTLTREAMGCVEWVPHHPAASLRLFPLCFLPIRFVSPCQKMDTYDQGNQWAGSKLRRRQMALIGIGRAALETASTAALPGVRLLCKLVF